MSSPTPVNIVQLIEKNPITRLSNTYNNQLLYRIKASFTDYEQQLFIASFYCYLNYENSNDFVVDLDNVWAWLGFNQKEASKRVLERNFVVNIDYKIGPPIDRANISPNDADYKIAFEAAKANIDPIDTDKKKTRGGHNKETILMTVKTFKLLCLKSQTKKAHEIHEYYLKMEELLHKLIDEESTELKKQLQQQHVIIEEQKIKLHRTEEIEREKILLNKFAEHGPLVYIIKVKSFENGEYIIKIGESRRGVKNRYYEHRKHYGNDILLLDCFLTDKSKNFESFLHKHPKIRQNRVTTLEGHETEYELFKIDNNLTYQMFSNIIDENIHKFKYYSYSDIEKLEKEIETLKNNKIENSVTNTTQNAFTEELNAFKETIKTELMNQNQAFLEKLTQQVLAKVNQDAAQQPKLTTNFNEPLPTIGPRLQKINPETMQLVKVYETAAECMKENNHIKRPSLNKAIVENKIYHGYRWLYVDRELEPNIIHGILPTIEIKIQNLGYIAKLNETKTEIINVYIDRKTASFQNGYESQAFLDAYVKNGKITNGHYYMLLDNCDETLKTNFKTKHGITEIILYKNGVGKYDTNNVLVKEFTSRYDCSRFDTIGEKSLSKALAKNIPYSNFYYRFLAAKLCSLQE
jgi:hypothetical protein